MVLEFPVTTGNSPRSFGVNHPSQWRYTMENRFGLQAKLLLAIAVILLAVFAITELLNYQTLRKNEQQDLQDQAERVRSLLMAYRNVQQKVFLEHKVPLDEVTRIYTVMWRNGRCWMT